MSKLTVLQTPVRFSPAIGGVEKYVLELSKDLVAGGDEVIVVSADEPHANSPAKINGITSIRLPFKTKVANTNITPHLFKALKAQKFDVLHTHIPTPWSADISALVSLVKRKPLVVTYHNDLVGDGIGGLIAKAYNATLLHFVLWRAKKIIITQEKYLEYSAHLKRHRRKVAVVPLGVNEPQKFSVKRDQNQLFFMSVLDKYHEYKGLDVLLEALAIVRKDFPKLHLVVGGKGELIEKYKAQAKELGIADSVKFLGLISDEERDKAYAASGAFVLPSTNSLEGFGIVALEALTYGTPVITTSLAGSSAYIKAHDAGVVVPPKDVKALADALRTLCKDPGKAREMGEKGRAFAAKEFSWKAIAAQMHHIYEEAGA
ncbi:MAG TPA: glycosyltransferase [Candidatus Saccharimonadales bacterium]